MINEQLEFMLRRYPPLREKILARQKMKSKISKYDAMLAVNNASFQDKMEYASIQLSARLMRVRHHPASSFTYPELGLLLGMRAGNTLRNIILRYNYPQHATFLLIVSNLSALEELLELEPMPQINPWEHDQN